jgi:short subunit dehydrogenase-like uncharacterized protein
MTLKIYGANGNTGELIAREARACGLTTILSRRIIAACLAGSTHYLDITSEIQPPIRPR